MSEVEPLDINSLNPAELAIVLRMRGMDYRDPVDAVLSLIRTSCVFNLRTGTPETDWKVRHDELATQILRLLDAGQSCPKNILDRVRGTHVRQLRPATRAEFMESWRAEPYDD